MVLRERYLEQLRKIKDAPLIKVITGVRRCGKSVLMRQFQNDLIENGVPDDHTQYLNFEEAENIPLDADWRTVNQQIALKLKPGRNYIFLDEVQNIKSWERLVDSLFVKPEIDLYLTGSNAYFLSSELSTLLSGRQFEVKILPFSYQEFLQATNPSPDSEEAFIKFLRYGGMPQATSFLDLDINILTEYLSGVYNTVVIKDILTRQRVNDSEVLNRLMRYAFDNIGNGFSAKKVADYLTSNYRAVASQTIERYLTAATEAFILYPVSRFNIRGKEILKTQKKYYVVDTGLRNAIVGRGATFDVGRALENTVYLELIRRGQQVMVGQTQSGKEIDFVAQDRDGNFTYYQVTETMRGEETRRRELVAFEGVKDRYESVILTLDSEENVFEGIRQRNVRKWLLEV